MKIDFAKDSGPIYIDRNYVCARGTPLGSDDAHEIVLALVILDYPADFSFLKLQEEDLKSFVVDYAVIIGRKYRDIDSNFKPLVQSASIYEELFGKKPLILLTHGHLETGALVQKIQECGREVDAIGIGPLSHGAYTTSEDLCIPSMQKEYDFICRMVEELK